MTPEDYCRNKAAPAGSNLYYSTLYHDAQTRRILRALFAFHHELNEVVCESSDPGAARVTLYWWFEEIGRLFSGEARHPVTRELSQIDNADYLSQQELMGCIAATAQFLDTPESGPYQAWLARHDAASGQIWKTAGRACGCSDPDTLAALAGTGSCHGAFELLHHVRHFAGLGLNVLPSDLLASHNLDLETVIRPDAGATTSGFFTDLFDRLHNDIGNFLSTLQEKNADAPLFSITLLRILDALCREYRSAGRPITHSRISLTPIRKLWIAWRTSRNPGSE
ncbi:MAG: squalene/phytoene synthase family protein [Gammaproteobacteria bacterium]|nr:squalene/phytoene synthase family protein [Gammaproteobacteria bacterium]